MFVQFFYDLREARIPVTIREYLTFLEALERASRRRISTNSTTCRARRW